MSDPTLFHIGTSTAWLDSTEVPPLNALVFDTVTASYRVGDGVNVFANLPSPSFGTKQVVVPVTGATIALAATRTLLNPAATLAALVFALPTAPVDNERIVISSSKTITAVTWTIPSGQAMAYEPTTLVAGAPISLIYDVATATWYGAE